MRYRWITGVEASQEDWDRIESICASRGWMSLNRELTLRILLVEDDEGLCGFLPLQLIPHTEPMWTAPRIRGTEVAAEMARQMKQFLDENDARGYLVIAESPFAAKICEHFGMHRVVSPVYAYIRGGA